MSAFQEDDASVLPSLPDWCSAESETSSSLEFVAGQDLFPMDENRKPPALHVLSQTCEKRNLCRREERFSSIRRLLRADSGRAARWLLAGIPSSLIHSYILDHTEIYGLLAHRKDHDEWDRYSNRT